MLPYATALRAAQHSGRATLRCVVLGRPVLYPELGYAVQQLVVLCFVFRL